MTSQGSDVLKFERCQQKACFFTKVYLSSFEECDPWFECRQCRTETFNSRNNRQKFAKEEIFREKAFIQQQRAKRDWLWGGVISAQAPPAQEQVWSLTQFYFVDFSPSRIGVKKCVFNKRTIKVCVSCCWRCPGTSAPSTAHLTVSLYLCSSGSNERGELRVRDGDEGVAGRNGRE